MLLKKTNIERWMIVWICIVDNPPMDAQATMKQLLMVSQALMRHLLMGFMMGYLLINSQVMQRNLLMDAMMERYLLMGAKERYLLMDSHLSKLVK